MSSSRMAGTRIADNVVRQDEANAVSALSRVLIRFLCKSNSIPAEAVYDAVCANLKGVKLRADDVEMWFSASREEQ